MLRNLRQYSKEFKQESVSLALSYANVNQAAVKNGLVILPMFAPKKDGYILQSSSTYTCEQSLVGQ